VPSPAPPSISLGDAFAGSGTFVFSAAPGLDIGSNAGAVVAGVIAALNQPIFPGSRAIAWILDPTAPAIPTIQLLGINASNAQSGNVNVGFLGGGAVLVRNNLLLTLRSGLLLTLKDDVLALTYPQGGNNLVQLTGPAAPLSASIKSATIPFSGPDAGTIRFTTSIKRQELNDSLRWGFQLLCGGGAKLRSQWYPLADGTLPNGGDMIRFDVAVDPSDPTNSRSADRTYFAFGGDGKTKVVSGYRTVYGDVVNLVPITQPASGEIAARLVLAVGNPDTPNPPEFALGPEGDFIMTLDGPKDGHSSVLLCGLTATETLTFTAGPSANPASGDRLRFNSRAGAFALAYPPVQASPVGPPFDPTRPTMDESYRTSWAILLNPPAASPSVHYSAQPKGSEMFGFDDVVSKSNAGLLGSVDPGYLLTSAAPFPLIPYALADLAGSSVSFDAAAVAGVEQFAVAPKRRTVIGAPANSQTHPPTRMSRLAATTNGGTMPATTPSGLVAQLETASGKLDSVLLGVNYAATDSGPMWMLFTDPPPKLQQALQTPQTFVVAANGANLGAFKTSPATQTPPAPTGTPTFYNTMSIEDWEISANVGATNKYNDYNNVLIVKGCKGKLIDLVAKTDTWTQKEDFSAPGGDDSQIVILSQWLTKYVQDGIDAGVVQKNLYFTNFADKATDPNWTGIIVLKATLTAIPPNLGGLLSVIAPAYTFAHHFGITISPVAAAANAISVPKSSSMFQLVYYVNPSFVPAVDPTQNQPLPPQADGPYDFQLLTLKALFENTSVKAFESLAQLTLGAFFGDPLLHMQPNGNVYGTIFLQGVYQHTGTIGTFLLDSLQDNLFYLDSNIINKVEITKAQFVTVDATTLRFDLWGYVDFDVLQGPAADNTTFPFDAFGFGYAQKPTDTRQGLSFSGLSVLMTVAAQKVASSSFEPGKIAFDPSRNASTPRAGSLYQAFALQLKGLLTGDATNDPSAQNYLTLATNAGLSGVTGKPWYALSFDLKMGSAGALAGKLGLDAGLVVAWAPGRRAADTSYDAMVGLRLPGVAAKTNLLSLEGILALSIGTMRLTYDVPSGVSKRYWVLWLTEIALKFLGLLKIPPNGSTSFVCFGNPAAGGDPTALGWYAVYNQDKQKQNQLATDQQGTGR
jgi:hypothetical protein